MVMGNDAARQVLLRVHGLKVEFLQRGRPVRAVDGVSFELEAGAVTGIVGESGSGKSSVANALMGLIPHLGGTIAGGSIEFDGTDLTRGTDEEWQRLRGRQISVVFQDPHTSLNPSFTIGNQLLETARRRRDRVAAVPVEGAASDRNRVLEALREVQLPDAERRMRNYPHELSGGMKQRVVSAAAIVNRPSLLIADEPTTALDLTLQAQYLALLRKMQTDLGMAVLVISHDLGVIAELCDEVIVMYGGRMVERGSVFQIFDEPAHPYTRGLLTSRFATGTHGQRMRLGAIKGQPPQLLDLPSGCSFHPRCSEVRAVCLEGPGDLIEVAAGHFVECHAGVDGL